MLISYQWIRELLGSHADPGSPRDVAEKLTKAGLEVEGITHAGANLAAVKVARVLSKRPHPAGKNTLVTIDAGDGALELVCGAPNVPDEGGFVCYAPVGATVFDRKGNSFVLAEKAIGGVVSRGMLCAEDELGLGSEHDGIVVLREKGLSAGTPLTKAFEGLEDWILEVNVTANRPDALGHVGVAREVAMLSGIPFDPPVAGAPARARGAAESDALELVVEDPQGCPTYLAQRVVDVTVGPSPLGVRTRLSRLGVRPINNVVDVTNIVLLERGQPLHAFDHDKLAGAKIVVRRAGAGESIETLDGQKRALDAADLVIADAAQPVAIAGVMGSEPSGVREGSTRVVLEAAFFHPSSVRRTAQRHKIHSEASHRFEREVDRDGVRASLARATELLVQMAGGVAVGEPVRAESNPQQPLELTLRYARCDLMLGYAVPRDDARRALAALGFNAVSHDDVAVTVRVPGWRRADVKREIDLVEEVARALGYHRIPTALPPTAGARAGSTRDFGLRRRVRNACTAAGLDEAVSFGFLSAQDLERTGLKDAPRARVTNPLSEERGLMRPSLVPALLRAAAHSFRHGEKRARLFEVGTAFAPRDTGDTQGDEYNRQLDDPLMEETRVAMLWMGPRDSYLARAESVDFYDGKGGVEAVVEALTNDGARFDRVGNPPPFLHPQASARVLRADGTSAGWVGELHPDACEAWELPRATVVAELRTNPLGGSAKTPVAKAPGRFPAVQRDVTLALAQVQPAGEVAARMREAAGPLCVRVEIIDRFTGAGVPAGSHALTYALWFRSDERTLQDKDVDEAVQRAVETAVAHYEAKQR